MASGYTQVAIANHYSLNVPIQIGVSYTNNKWPRISVWVITPCDPDIGQANLDCFKKLQFDDLILSEMKVSPEVLKQSLEMWREKEPVLRELRVDHPWVRAGFYLWKNYPEIGNQALAAGC
jgi:hypothetical protein